MTIQAFAQRQKWLGVEGRLAYHAQPMFVLIAYDVSTVTKAGARRLRRVAQACKDYGQRVQNSVFECRLDEKHWVLLRGRLLSEIDRNQDSLRFYFLDADTAVEHYGVKPPLDLEAPLIV
jgi:CRISPR-associated protein Cas2